MKLIYNQFDMENQTLSYLTDQCEYGNLAKSFYLLAEDEIHEERPRVLALTLQITDECNRTCTYCAQTQCPECIKYGTNQSMEYEQAVSLMDSFYSYGLKKLILCGGEPALYDSIGDLIQYARKRGIDVLIHTNGLIPIQTDLSGIEVVIHIDSLEQFEIVEENYEKMDYVIVLLYDTQERIQPKNSTWKILRKKHDQGMEEDVVVIDFVKLENRCLNSRIHIMNNFDVVTSLGSLNYVGNVKKDSIEDIMYRLSQNEKSNGTKRHLGCKENECKDGFSYHIM